MSDFLDELIAAVRSPIAVWHQYTLAYRPEPSRDFYVFFEGEADAAFFLPFVRQKLGADVKLHSYICFGKKNVLRVLGDVRNSNPGFTRTVFFVDKDLEDLIPEPSPKDPALFCTDWYSIENYCVSEHHLEALWTDFFSLETDDPRLSVVRQKFLESHGLFVRVARPLMAWILFHRRIGTKLNLNNLSLDKLFVLDDDMVPSRSSGFALHIHTQTGLPLFGMSIRRNIAELASISECKVYLRGKYELWFFLLFVRRVISMLSQSDAQGRKPSRKVELNDSTAIALLGSRGIPPERLMAFLESAIPSRT